MTKNKNAGTNVITSWSETHESAMEEYKKVVNEQLALRDGNCVAAAIHIPITCKDKKTLSLPKELFNIMDYDAKGVSLESDDVRFTGMLAAATGRCLGTSALQPLLRAERYEDFIERATDLIDAFRAGIYATATDSLDRQALKKCAQKLADDQEKE